MKRWLDTETRQMLDKVIEDNLNYLVRFATIRIGNKSDAEDVVHEAVRRLLEADIPGIKKGSVRMYLFRIVYNLCKDRYISAQRMRSLAEADEDIPDSAAEAAQDFEEIERLNRLLDCLPEREAEVVIMKAMDELSFVEISKILAIPASTVKSRFKSGMNKLRKQYFNNR